MPFAERQEGENTVATYMLSTTEVAWLTIFAAIAAGTPFLFIANRPLR
jgi:hypothetical protein